MNRIIQQLDRHNERRLHLAVVIARGLADDGAAPRAATLAQFREADAAYVAALNALAAADLPQPIDFDAIPSDPALNTEPDCCS